MKITVFGAGAWGTAIAASAAARNEVLLWGRDAAQMQAIASARCNAAYLDAVGLPRSLRITSDHRQALAHARGGLAVIATPMSALRERLLALDADMPALWLCKGFEADRGALGHEIARELRPGVACGILSGPSFALEVARRQPTALVVASDDAALAAAAVEAFHDDALRVYTSADVVGVEVGGAVKNVLAIAVGVLDGIAEAAAGDPARSGRAAGGVPGMNARAALITRGLAEMTRLGVALGARAETFMGLSGLGDLVLTSTGHLSRNRKVGLLLAAGRSLPEVLGGLGHVAEGVPSAPTVLARARALGVDMPITEAVADVLAARVEPAEAIARLMSRHARSEN